MDDRNLTLSQRGLLDWVADKVARYHECHGDDLNRLIELGLVEVVDGAVTLTPAGRALAYTEEE